MLAYLVLLLAALSRLFPHALHGVGLNVTAVGGGLLFFGSRRARWQAVVAVVVMALTDVYLTRVSGYQFHMRDYVVTWAWYGAICLVGSGLLRKVTPVRVVAGVLCSATSFFVLSNLAVWVQSGMYPHTGAGLLACYTAALPFYGNDLVSTSLTAAVLFGLPVVAAQMVRGFQQVSSRRQPLA
jgi:hypothetical protein